MTETIPRPAPEPTLLPSSADLLAALAGHVPRHHPQARLLYAVFLLANLVAWLNTDGVVSRDGVDGSLIINELGIRNFEDSAREKLSQVIAEETRDYPHAADHVALMVRSYQNSGVPGAMRLYDKATNNALF
ncbi:hypothetical protein [Nocardia asteroides]|uniref:hypothetical protein n=1 Tax=Nocardia asteroides TaxID=1824 RepID=UPI001E308240|nr:hypothetical protein [Nocardia asteroides]UGT62121.1 hypothetical protein LTT61_01850 [Nocardia asteroides]